MKNNSMPKIKLKDITSRIGDGLHGTPEYIEDGEIYFVNGVNLQNGKIIITDDTKKISIQEYQDNFIDLNKKTLLMSINGTIGKMAFYNGEQIMLGKSAAYLNFNDGLNVFFYYYFQLKNVNQYLYNVATGSTIKNLGLKTLGETLVPNIDQENASQIAKILSDLDAKIEVNKQINAKLEAMAKTLYEYWFVQFDFPDENGKPYKSSGGKMVYNRELKREIPEGWKVKTIKNLIKSDKSGDWGKAEKHKNYIKKVNCIRGADLNGLNGQGNVNAPTRFILEKNEHKLLKSGDFIIEISGGSPTQSTGRIGMVIDETFERFDNDLICSNFCRAISLKDEYFTFNFLQFWNRIYEAGVLFGWEGKTSGIKNLLLDNFISKFKIIKPSDKTVKAYYKTVKPYYSKIQKNLVENQKLAELRDWLLPMLMNGQVTVGENTSLSEMTGRARERKQRMKDFNTNFGMVAEDKEEYLKKDDG